MLAPLVAEVSANGECEADHREEQRDQGGRAKGDERSVPERVAPPVRLDSRTGGDVEGEERPPGERGGDAWLVPGVEVEPQLVDTGASGRLGVDRRRQRIEIADHRLTTNAGEARYDTGDLDGDELAVDPQRQCSADAACQCRDRLGGHDLWPLRRRWPERGEVVPVAVGSA